MDFNMRLAFPSYIDSLPFVVGAGLFTHFIFKRTETHKPAYLGVLIVGFPAALTLLFARHFSSTIGAGTIIFMTFWSTLAASVLTYRLSPWHPLEKYPGPVLCKVSKLWIAFLSLRGKQHVYYARLHAQYGDVVRIGPNELSVCDVAAVAPILGPQGLRKGPYWDGRIPETEVVRPLITLRNKVEHTRRRRSWTRAFSATALKEYEAIVTKRGMQLVDILANQKGVVDLTKWVSYFSYDFMNDLAFGGGTEMMSAGGDPDGLWHLMEAGQRIAQFLSQVPWLGRLFMRCPHFAQDLKAFRTHAKKCAVDRRRRGPVHKDLFYHLLDEDGISTQPPNVVEVISDSGLAIVAGSDTTSSALSNLFFFLLSNPTAYKRLQAEVDELGNDVLDFGKQAQMLYLNAAINEALRLYPPVLSGSQRYVDEAKGLGDHFVPGGTSVFIPFFCLHRDPRYFSPLPDTFIPERWLSRDKQAALEPTLFKDQTHVVHNTHAFIPFSTGPTNCVGKSLAWLEMRMVVCLIMQRFELRFEKGYRKETWEEEMLDYFVMLKGRLPVVLTERK